MEHHFKRKQKTNNIAEGQTGSRGAFMVDNRAVTVVQKAKAAGTGNSRGAPAQLVPLGFGSSAPRFQQTFTTRTGLTGIMLPERTADAPAAHAAPAAAVAAVPAAAAPAAAAVDPEERRRALLAQHMARINAAGADDASDEEPELDKATKLRMAHQDLVQELGAQRYLIGGSYGAAQHGSTRDPGDLDVMFRTQADLERAHETLSGGDSHFDAAGIRGGSFKMTHTETEIKIDVGLLQRHMETDATGEIAGESERGMASPALLIAGALSRWEDDKEDKKQVQDMINCNNYVKNFIDQVLPKVKPASRDDARERWDTLTFPGE